MKDLIIYGADAMAHYFINELSYYHRKEPAAITLDSEYISEPSLFGIAVIPFDQIEKKFPPDAYEMIVFGPADMRSRKQMYEKAKLKGYSLINYISPDAFVDPDVQLLGDNNVIFRGAEVGFGGKMGSGNIIRHKVYLGHDFTLGNHVILSPGCTIGGNCTIGDLSWIGLGATIRDNVTIGDEVLIGMGSVVTKDIESYATAIGVPAKITNHHEAAGVSIYNKTQEK